MIMKCLQTRSYNLSITTHPTRRFSWCFAFKDQCHNPGIKQNRLALDRKQLCSFKQAGEDAEKHEVPGIKLNTWGLKTKGAPLLSRSIMFNSRDPMDCSPPGSSVCGISQARTLEWAAISFSRGPFRPRDGTSSPEPTR